MTEPKKIMTYEEFEWHILRLVYEDGVDRLQPAYLAYALGLPHETVTNFLEHATESGLVEIEVNDDGHFEYRIPGVDRERPLPSPVWKNEQRQAAEAARVDGARANDGSPVVQAHPVDPDEGYVARGPRPRVDRDHLPPALRAHIEERYAGADGSIFDAPRPAPIVAYGTRADSPVAPHPNATALERRPLGPLRVESSGESFCDPSQTVFMRQIRVHGARNEKALREHVQRMFESFGYRIVHSDEDRLRFERGSVTFILALVPLFVLVLPLFVYLFLYCMGRSTIHQEPVELDVQFRQHDGPDPYTEIDLTFVGLHGVVLGAADQRVLNQEIDTLREGLRCSLIP